MDNKTITPEEYTLLITIITNFSKYLSITHKDVDIETPLIKLILGADLNLFYIYIYIHRN